MNQPRRIQRKRAKGWRKPEGAQNCTRGPGQIYGNPFEVTESGPYTTVQAATEAFIDWLAGTAHYDVEPERRKKILEALRSGVLRGRDLMCYCDEDEQWCHANALLKLANRPRPALRVTPPTLSPHLLRRS